MTYNIDELIQKMRADSKSDWPTRLLKRVGRAPLVEKMPLKAEWASNRTLSKGEKEILSGYSYGLTNSMIAEIYDISYITVNQFRKAAIYKLKAKNINHAVAIAIRTGLIQ